VSRDSVSQGGPSHVSEAKASRSARSCRVVVAVAVAVAAVPPASGSPPHAAAAHMTYTLEGLS
jgi:hypothetical protein